MKKIKLVAVMAVGGVLLAQGAQALQITRISGYDGGGGGGEFTVFGLPNVIHYADDATYTDARGTGFQTFCLELDERWTAWPSGYTVNPYSIEGGKGGASYIDPPGEWRDNLSIGTTWLYRQFSDGVLAGYDYDITGDRTTSARALQDAIWWLEHELAYVSSGAQVLLDLALASTEISDIYGTMADYEALRADADPYEFGVAVANWYIYDDQGNIEQRQSMLKRVPDGGVTIVLLGLGLLGCGVTRRRLV